jgi:hypothetical protein
MFFLLLIEKTFFDHNPGYYEFFNETSIPKCVEINSLHLSKLILPLLSNKTEDNLKN